MTRFGKLPPSIVAPPPGPASRTLADRLRLVESRNVTHMTEDFPVFWEEARGANVRDADGNVYLDFTSAFGVALAGHAHPHIVSRTQAQAERMIHGMGDIHPPSIKVELLERLQALAPWSDGLGVLASSGSEAVEIALKTALLKTSLPGIIAFQGGYHGLTFGALSTTARGDFRAPFESRIYSGVRFAPFPHPFCMGADAASVALDAVTEAFSQADGIGEPVGAVIIEPIQGRGGVRIPPTGFLKELAELTRSRGALLIFDEVFTGMGRTGKSFAFHHEAVTPDLLCLGKALGGGLPLSVCLGPREIMDSWPESGGEALHTSTFLGHPLSCAAALAALDLHEEMTEHSETIGATLLGNLKERFRDDPRVGEVRGRGLMIGIELVDPENGDPLVGGGAKWALEALRKGLLVLPAGDLGEVVEITPPAVLTQGQVEWWLS